MSHLRFYEIRRALYFLVILNKMVPKKRTTRVSPATTTTTTTPVINAQLKALIDQDVTDALAARDADRSMNGNDNHNSGTGVRRQAPLAREGEIKKLEVEMWNLKVKGTDVVSYNQRFQELALMCARMFPKESDKIKKYVDAENKRKLDNNNQAQQQPPKKQGVATTYTIGSGERKEYAGTLPLSMLELYRCATSASFITMASALSDCPELKNQNYGNQAGGTGARGMVHALGGGETNQDLNDMEDDINA
nr:hypothetical protein [Tanacetum cinerariifolium]